MTKCRGLFFILLFTSLFLYGGIDGVWAQSPLIQWKKLQDGLFFAEIDAPLPSPINDSKLTLLKIEPANYDFQLLTASEFGQHSRPAEEWACEFNAQIIVNAGMYTATKSQHPKGFCKNFEHVANAKMSGYYNAMLSLHPKDSLLLPFSIIDMTCQSWDSFQHEYSSFCQAMRMIDCSRNAMAWDKKPGQSCSMVIASTDSAGNIYFIFSRSPYTHQTMIKFLLDLPIDLRSTVYLEGGPETSLFIQTPDTTIRKFGSFISGSWERDDNDHFWDIPNVIAIRKKK